MSDTRKPGEYLGADGRKRGIKVDNCPIDTTAFGDIYWYIPAADLRALSAAAAALADELETEVVELGPYYRLVLRPGKDAELEFRWGTSDNPSWGPVADNLSISLCADLIKLGHRAGLAKAEDK